jgi:hypothetical protein
MAMNLRYERAVFGRLVERKSKEGLGYASRGLLPVKPSVRNQRQALSRVGA